jgi:hypothetical protein
VQLLTRLANIVCVARVCQVRVGLAFEGPFLFRNAYASGSTWKGNNS